MYNVRPLLFTSTVPSLGSFRVEITTVFARVADVIVGRAVPEIAALATSDTVAASNAASKSILRIEYTSSPAIVR
jgi:hypothetical protein